jgi:membrane protease YdiL (CAAX protease family)
LNPLVMAAFLVVAGNAASFFDASGLPGAGLARLALGLVVGAAVLAWSRLAGLSREELGLRRSGALAGAASGVALAFLAAGAGLLLLRAPPLVPGPITYQPALDLATEAFLLHLAVFLPLGVALPEELAFRGALLAALAKRMRTPSAILVASLAFTLWHVAIVVPTVGATNLREPILVTLAYGGAAVVLFAGGIALAVLRLRFGTLAAPFAAHWAFNAAMLVGLRALS